MLREAILKIFIHGEEFIRFELANANASAQNDT